MTVVAQDPNVRRSDGRILMAKVRVPAEDLMPGPVGHRVQVVDFDATGGTYLGSHTIPARYGSEPREWRNGDPSICNDFAFHAQNVLALVMTTLKRFEFALGRRLGWSFRSDAHQIKIAPHGFRDANAFYSPEIEGLAFGYFEVAPGETAYTALSHDIVVHETTHALLAALRERYLVPSNPDQAAFHEGFADVIALLSVFALRETVEYLLQPPGDRTADNHLIAREDCEPDALKESALFGLAAKMGPATTFARGEPLRKSARLVPDPALLDSAEFAEPHRRGEIFVAAVMHAFIQAWSDRILASGVPRQRTFPLGHIVEEGADIADALATLWIRAIDYMPPIHLTFRDALTAALTSDARVRPDDSRFHLRACLKDSFAAFGILPVTTKGHSDCWDPPPPDISFDRVRFDSLRTDKDEVFRFLWDNKRALELRTDAFTKVQSVRPCMRIGPDGFVVRETVACYHQQATLTTNEMAHEKIAAPRELAAAGERLMPTLYGGGVLIFDEYGGLRYHIHNSVFGKRQTERLDYLWQAGVLRHGDDDAGMRATRLSTLHRLRALDVRVRPSERW
jgi:hypothetical protein